MKKKNLTHNFSVTTVEIAKKVGSVEILNRIVDDLKDENEQYRKMVMETVQMIMQEMGSAEVDSSERDFNAKTLIIYRVFLISTQFILKTLGVLN